MATLKLRQPGPSRAPHVPPFASAFGEALGMPTCGLDRVLSDDAFWRDGSRPEHQLVAVGRRISELDVRIRRPFVHRAAIPSDSVALRWQWKLDNRGLAPGLEAPIPVWNQRCFDDLGPVSEVRLAVPERDAHWDRASVRARYKEQHSGIPSPAEAVHLPQKGVIEVNRSRSSLEVDLPLAGEDEVVEKEAHAPSMQLRAFG